MSDEQKLYKVLMNGKSMNGGDLKWGLPRRKKGGGWTPGKWHEVEGIIRVCFNGLHLTTEPFRWYEWNASIYEAQGEGDTDNEGDDKTAFRRARLLRPMDMPQWIKDAQEFIAKLPSVNWFKPDNQPNPNWKLFPDRNAAWNAARNAAWDAAWNAAWNAARNAAWDAVGNAARNAAWDAAWNAAWDAAWNAAWDAARDAAWSAVGNAALYTRVEFVCAGLQLDEKHREHIRARWEVWTKGYGLLCDIDGILYVYEKVS